MQSFTESIVCLLQRGENLVMATIINSRGSTPRGTGTQMIIRQDGSIVGSIGGGLLEADVHQKGLDLFKTRGVIIQNFNLKHDDLTVGTMICGGTVEVMLEHLAPDQETLEIFLEIKKQLEERKRCSLLTQISRDSAGNKTMTKWLMVDGRIVGGNSPLPDISNKSLKESMINSRYPALTHASESKYFIQPISVPIRLFVFGAGHISKQIAGLATKVGFQTAVIDDRKDFLTPERFPNPTETRFISNFADCLSHLNIGKDDYLVIVTRGHLHDKIVLEQCLRTEAVFIGMIGSRRKRDKIYGLLKEEGLSENDLAKIHCPIGLPIGADTPEEIAISILAELIKTRSTSGAL